MNQTLYEDTMALLESCDETIPEIADGAGVNRHWLAKLKQRKFENPGVVSIQKLHNYLSRNQSSNDAA